MTNKRHEDAYPAKLRREEAALIEQRRVASGQKAQAQAPAEITDATAIAISGGGIRSATFALGVFQAFAAQRYLRKVDFLSTVSGGGYFGGFFCGLFARKSSTKNWDAVEKALQGSSEIAYLRDNGRYLAPAGSDDLWLLISTVLRNWIAVLIALSSAVALLFLGLEIGTVKLVAQLSGGARQAIDGLDAWGATHELALSPWLLLVPVLFLMAATPLGWAYWLASQGSIAPLFARVFAAAERRADARERSLWQHIVQLPKLGTFIIVGAICAIADAFIDPYEALLEPVWQAGHLLAWIVCAALAAETISHRDSRDARPGAHVLVALTFGVIAALYVAIFMLCVFYAPRPTPDGFWARKTVRGLIMFAASGALLGAARAVTAWMYQSIASALQSKWRNAKNDATPEDEDHFARHSLSVWLSRILSVTAAVALIGVVQSISRTFYVHASQDTLMVFFASTFAAAFGAQSVGRKVMSFLSSRSNDKQLPISGTVAAYVIGLGLSLALITASATAVLLYIYPKCTAAEHTAKSEVHLCIKGKDGVQCDESSVVMASAAPESDFETCVANLRAPSTPSELNARGERPHDHVSAGVIYKNAGIAGFVLGILSLVLGSSHLFLNSSSQLPIYTARITRTFLGASNPKRTGPPPVMGKPEHWLQPSADQIASQKAATQIMPGDDIKLGEYWSNASDGPFARGGPLHIINVTINETVDGRSRTQQADRKGLGLAIGPRALTAGVRHHALLEWKDGDRLLCETTQADASFSVFDYRAETKTKGDERRIFDGEALSIGRWLGISGAAFSTGTGYRTNLGMSLLAGLANVRLGYWWDSGVARRLDLSRVLGALFWTHQYLQRELFARFPGTANKLWYLSDGGHFENTGAYELIRRRVPRIVILDAGCDPDYSLEDLGNLVRKARLDFGAEITFLEHGEIANHIHPDARKYVGTLAELARPELSKPSLVHAALARVRYPDCDNDGLLLFIKPTIVTGEPADVVRYHSERPEFPHETTLDQFFGEPQWESYRALGQHIGARLCVGPYGPFKDPPSDVVTKPDPRPQA